MWKWLVITVIVVMAFMTILLGLGYLLKENEKATTALKQQLDQQAQLQRNKAENRQLLIMPTIDATPHSLQKQQATQDNNTKLVIEQFQNIVIENLTCISEAQCLIATVAFANVNCNVAINSIGASMLAKLNTRDKNIEKCPQFKEENHLSCQQNACTMRLD